jgi:hypothetical protein
MFSCKPKVKVEGPKQTEKEIRLTAPSSRLSLPVTLPIADIEAIINKELQGVFFDEWMQVNKEQDSLHLRVERMGEARIRWTGKELKTTFPLRIQADYVKRVFGVRVTNPQPVETEVILALSSNVGLQQGWNFQTQTRLDNVEWIKNPELRIAMVKIDLKSPVEKALIDNQAKLLADLDKILSKEIKIDKEIAKIWHDIQKPITISKADPQVHLLTRPQSIAAKLGSTANGDISVLLSLQANIEAKEGELQEITFLELPLLNMDQEVSDQIDLYISAFLPFSKANILLNEAIEGQEIAYSGYKVSIQNATLYGIDEGIALDLEVSGSVKGNLFFQGQIAYDEESGRFFVENLKYDVATENILLQSASTLFYDQLVSYLAGKLEFDASPLSEEIPNLITQAINQSKLNEKLALNLSDFSIIPYEMAVDKHGMHAIVRSRMQARLDVRTIL